MQVAGQVDVGGGGGWRCWLQEQDTGSSKAIGD